MSIEEQLAELERRIASLERELGKAGKVEQHFHYHYPLGSPTATYTFPGWTTSLSATSGGNPDNE